MYTDRMTKDRQCKPFFCDDPEGWLAAEFKYQSAAKKKGNSFFRSTPLAIHENACKYL